jgi:phytoene dehydrogenase-like protein
LHHCMSGAWFNVVGGMGSVTAALAAAARAAAVPVDIVTGARAARILVDGGGGGGGGGGSGARVAGVQLEGGRVLRAPLVLSTAAPAATLTAEGTPLQAGLLPEAAELLPADALARLRRFDCASPVMKINCALDALPRFHCALPQDSPALAAALAGEEAAVARARAPGEVAPGAAARASPPHLRGTIHFERDVATIEAAFRDAAAGRAGAAAGRAGASSRRPLVELTLPSVLDGSIAPPGKHVGLLFVQYACPDAAHWAAHPGARDALADAAFAVVEEHAPGFTASVRHRDVLAPPDIGDLFGLEGGSIFQGAMDLSQLFWARPAPGLGSYRTPVAGLYLSGAGTHPGGGVMGASGHNAAMQALRDGGARRASLRAISSCPTL